MDEIALTLDLVEAFQESDVADPGVMLALYAAGLDPRDLRAHIFLTCPLDNPWTTIGADLTRGDLDVPTAIAFFREGLY